MTAPLLQVINIGGEFSAHFLDVMVRLQEAGAVGQGGCRSAHAMWLAWLVRHAPPCGLAGVWHAVRHVTVACVTHTTLALVHAALQAAGIVLVMSVLLSLGVRESAWFISGGRQAAEARPMRGGLRQAAAWNAL